MQGSGCKLKLLFIIVYIPIIFFLHVCACRCVSLCVFVCAQMCGCTVACDLWYLNVCVRGFQVMKAHIFLNFIFLAIREKDEFYFSLDSATSIKKPINPLKVVYHPVSCLLHHYKKKLSLRVVLLAIICYFVTILHLLKLLVF